jgi:hypothetical protein
MLWPFEIFMTIRDILWPFGTLCVHLVHFSGFGVMDQNKSGNPALFPAIERSGRKTILLMKKRR